jgi:hypothetical protein
MLALPWYVYCLFRWYELRRLYPQLVLINSLNRYFELAKRFHSAEHNLWALALFSVVPWGVWLMALYFTIFPPPLPRRAIPAPASLGKSLDFVARGDEAMLRADWH